MKPPRKFDPLPPDSATGLPPDQDALVRKIASQVAGLLVRNWTQAAKVLDNSEKGKLAFGLSVKVETGGKRPIVQTKFRMASEPTKDEEVGIVDDPKQANLPLAQ